MSHDEITTKLELEETNSSKIVHVDFQRESEARKRAKATEPTSVPLPPIFEPGRSSFFPNFSDIQLSSPWVLRLTAVVLVVMLSLLIL